MMLQCQETLIQYTEFLETNISRENYASMLPSILELIQKYHLEPETAFYVSRSVLPLKYVCNTCNCCDVVVDVLVVVSLPEHCRNFFWCC